MAKLTPKQENFAQRFVELGNASEAYRQAYQSTAKPDSVQVAACRLMKEEAVKARIEELRQDMQENAMWSRIDSINVLAEIARGKDPAAKTGDRVSAVKEINSMFGWKRQEVKHSGEVKQPLVIEMADFGGDEDEGE